MVIRIDDGSTRPSARGRGRVWRAARRAVEEARGGDEVWRRLSSKPKRQRRRHGKRETERDRPGNVVGTLCTSRCACQLQQQQWQQQPQHQRAPRRTSSTPAKSAQPQRQSRPRESRGQDSGRIARTLLLLSRSRVSTSTVLRTRLFRLAYSLRHSRLPAPRFDGRLTTSSARWTAPRQASRAGQERRFDSGDIEDKNISTGPVEKVLS